MLDEVLRVDQHERARLRLAAVLVVAGTTHLVTRWLDGGVPLGRVALVEEITRVGTRALLA